MYVYVCVCSVLGNLSYCIHLYVETAGMYLQINKFIHSYDCNISVQSFTMNIIINTFKLALFRILRASRCIVCAVVYRALQSSASQFLDYMFLLCAELNEFDELIIQP